MTTADDYTQAEPLPGLEIPESRNMAPLVRALHRSIAALEASGKVTEVDAFYLEGIRVLARSAEMKLATGRGSTIANDMGEAFRRFELLVAGETGVDSDLRDAMEKLNAALDGADQGAKT